MNSPLAPDTLNKLVPLCSGCGACMNSCPKNAIKLVPDAEGFVRPRVHSMDCTGCKTCIRICPVLHAESHPSPQQNPLAVYAGWNKDESIRLASSSGGIFSALAISILKKGGTVYGAAMGENLRVRHIRITTPEELSTLRGSKYNPERHRMDIPHRQKRLERGPSSTLLRNTVPNCRASPIFEVRLPSATLCRYHLPRRPLSKALPGIYPPPGIRRGKPQSNLCPIPG